MGLARCLVQNCPDMEATCVSNTAGIFGMMLGPCAAQVMACMGG